MNWNDVREEVTGLLQDLVRFDTTNPPGNEMLCAEYIAQVLRREGFREVQVIYHLDPPSFADTAWWSPYLVLMAALKAISLIAPRRENICPWVAVRGIK